MMQNKIIVFDLDDTLYKEMDFLKSAYKYISKAIGHEDAYDMMVETYRQHGNAFEAIISKYGLAYQIGDLLEMYRSHRPLLELDVNTQELLRYLYGKYYLGIITDGRQVTQWNKIAALGLDKFIAKENVVISEAFRASKPFEDLYLFFMERYPKYTYYYIGDNTEKDFVTPNRLGWDTICLLDDGNNVHAQDFTLDNCYLPKYRIQCMCELHQFF